MPWDATSNSLKARIKLGDSPSGLNINLECGALHPEDAGLRVEETGADLGICLDGDADRVIFCDASGEVVSGDRILCLCAKAMQEAGSLHGSTLVATVMSNLGLRDALADDGIALETTGVGDRLVIDRMREKGFSLGGENSGHIIFSDYATTGDGILSALKVLSLMKEKGATLADLAECMLEYPQEQRTLPVREKRPLEELPQLMEAIRRAEDALDGHGRTLVRYSGTENKLRILVECPDRAIADQQAEAIEKMAQQLIGA
jgi:phosphoglucosamine mutase